MDFIRRRETADFDDVIFSSLQFIYYRQGSCAVFFQSSQNYFFFVVLPAFYFAAAERTGFKVVVFGEQNGFADGTGRAFAVSFKRNAWRDFQQENENIFLAVRLFQNFYHSFVFGIAQGFKNSSRRTAEDD